MDDGALKERLQVKLGGVAGAQVDVHEGRVVLSGNVATWFDADEAERLAWATPGVRGVDNRLAYPAGTGTAEVENIP